MQGNPDCPFCRGTGIDYSTNSWCVYCSDINPIHWFFSFVTLVTVLFVIVLYNYLIS